VPPDRAARRPIEFPKPITLFERFPHDPKDQGKELFKVTEDIGIPGLSIGPVGVVAHIGARLGVSYYVGRGELRDVKLEAGFDPLEETKNLPLARPDSLRKAQRRRRRLARRDFRLGAVERQTAARLTTS
jgi:hypothetical protein